MQVKVTEGKGWAQLTFIPVTTEGAEQIQRQMEADTDFFPFPYLAIYFGR